MPEVDNNYRERGELKLVRKFIDDVGMKFGLDMCATVSDKRGKFEQGKNIALMDGQTLANFGIEKSYKYLDIQHQANEKDVEKSSS